MDNQRIELGFEWMTSRYGWGIALCVCWYLFACSGPCFSKTGYRTALVVSQKIRPYVQVVDGIVDRAGQSPNQVDVFFLSKPGPNTSLMEELVQASYDFVTAVGPEAAKLIGSSIFLCPKIYTAVLDPDNLPMTGDLSCGIPLRIPVKDQIKTLAQTFPMLKRIGLLYDPRHNSWFYDQAISAAHPLDITITPLAIEDRSQIPAVLKSQKETIDAIWMIPDQTIISEKIIYYVIKQGLYSNIGVIGYNSFFSRSGAFFSFEFDYRDLGVQAGEKILTILNMGDCTKESPVFKSNINRKIAEKIGIEVVQ